MGFIAGVELFVVIVRSIFFQTTQIGLEGFDKRRESLGGLSSESLGLRTEGVDIPESLEGLTPKSLDLCSESLTLHCESLGVSLPRVSSLAPEILDLRESLGSSCRESLRGLTPKSLCRHCNSLAACYESLDHVEPSLRRSAGDVRYLHRPFSEWVLLRGTRSSREVLGEVLEVLEVLMRGTRGTRGTRRGTRGTRSYR